MPRKEREATIVISYNFKHPVVTVTNIHFFMIRIVKEWNNLPEWVVEAGNLACFKRSLESFLNIS